MKGLIFAAGLGTRLYPLTQQLPKALVEVGGEPMLARVIRKFRGAGISEIVINVHHFADKIVEFLNVNENFGVNIHVSREEGYPLETGGGLLKVASLLGGDELFVVHNADILTDFPLEEMLVKHNENAADVTLLVDERTSSRQLLFDENFLMRGWKNVKTGQLRPAALCESGLLPRAFGGVHVITPQPFFTELERWAAHEVFSITDFYIAMCSTLRIQGFTPSLPYGWHDIGTLEKLRAAEDYLK